MIKYSKAIKNLHGSYKIESNDNSLYIFVSFLVYRILEYNYEFLMDWLQGKYKQNFINDNMFILVRQGDQIITYFEYDARDKDDGKDNVSIPHFKESRSFFTQAINDFIKSRNLHPSVDGILIIQESDRINIAPLKIKESSL
jgi:hypothetical protein